MSDRRRPQSTAQPRQAQLNLRVSEEERLALKQAAADAGLDLVALIRKRILGRADSMRPTAPADIIEVRRCLTQLGTMSADLHGLHRIASLGEIPCREELERACADHRQALTELMRALGRAA